MARRRWARGEAPGPAGGGVCVGAGEGTATSGGAVYVRGERRRQRSGSQLVFSSGSSKEGTAARCSRVWRGLVGAGGATRLGAGSGSGGGLSLSPVEARRSRAVPPRGLGEETKGGGACVSARLTWRGRGRLVFSAGASTSGNGASSRGGDRRGADARRGVGSGTSGLGGALSLLSGRSDVASGGYRCDERSERVGSLIAIISAANAGAPGVEWAAVLGSGRAAGTAGGCASGRTGDGGPGARQAAGKWDERVGRYWRLQPGAASRRAEGVLTVEGEEPQQAVAWCASRRQRWNRGRQRSARSARGPRRPGTEGRRAWGRHDGMRRRGRERGRRDERVWGIGDAAAGRSGVSGGAFSVDSGDGTASSSGMLVLGSARSGRSMADCGSAGRRRRKQRRGARRIWLDDRRAEAAFARVWAAARARRRAAVGRRVEAELERRMADGRRRRRVDEQRGAVCIDGNGGAAGSASAGFRGLSNLGNSGRITIGVGISTKGRGGSVHVIVGSGTSGVGQSRRIGSRERQGRRPTAVVREKMFWLAVESLLTSTNGGASGRGRLASSGRRRKHRTGHGFRARDSRPRERRR